MSHLLPTFHKQFKEKGLSLIELVVAIFIMVLVVGAAFSVYVLAVKGYKGESKASEAVISLELAAEVLRRDIEHAGCGLFTKEVSVNYTEASYNVNGVVASQFNDAPSGVPRALILGNETCAWAPGLTSDWLVIKSARVADNKATRVWGVYDAERGNFIRTGEEKDTTSFGAIFLQIEGKDLKLFKSGDQWSWKVKVSGNSITEGLPSGLPLGLFLVFGLRSADDDPPARPFHRVDYLVSVPNSGLPEKCAPGTGILYRVLLQNDGGATYQPLVDCVRDFQVAIKFGDSWVANLTASPVELRGKVSEVRVFILVQEGQRFDRKVTDMNELLIGDEDTGNIKAVYLTEEDKYYRWRLLRVVARPVMLRG